VRLEGNKEEVIREKKKTHYQGFCNSYFLTNMARAIRRNQGG
jgi:hypothetical protein